MSTLLPSDYPPGSLPAHLYSTIRDKEHELRRASCLKALQLVRSCSIQRSHVLRANHKHGRGIKAFTHAHSYAERISQKQQHAQWLYTHACTRLERLGMSSEDKLMFLPLRESDIKSLNSFRADRRELGDGQVKLPWYWRVDFSKADKGGRIESTRSDVEKECEDSKYKTSFPSGILNPLLLPVFYHAFVWSGSRHASGTSAGRKKFIGFNERLHQLFSPLSLISSHGTQEPHNQAHLAGPLIVCASAPHGNC